MAIRKETFLEARVGEYWKNTLNDDYALSAAVHAAGGTIAYAPGAAGFNRATLTKAALPEYQAWFRRRAWLHVIWVPLATWIWLVGLAASVFGNTIEWRGPVQSIIST